MAEEFNAYNIAIDLKYFTVENLVNNEIDFLDENIFIEDRRIKFRKTFKMAEKTVLTNFKLSISPYKYKANNIFTQLHQTRDCCSDEEQFSQALNELRDLFAKISYPKKLME
jgi:hypothetical protein